VVALIGRPGFEEESLEGVARLEVGSEEASHFLKQMSEDTLVFVSGSSVFMHGLACQLVGKTWVVLALDSGNRVTAKI
jgi:hypothetical protein